MRSKTISVGILTLGLLFGTLANAAAPPNLPEPVTTRQQSFAIPFRVETTDDPARRPAELQLFVSTDRGAHWQLYAKAQPSQQHFLFRAGPDGEYWFAVRTVDRSGQARPEVVATPGLRVIVDTSAQRQNQPPARTAAKPVAARNVPQNNESKGSVAIAINPPIGKKYSAGNERRAAGGSISELPPGERPRMVNSRMFELEYDIDSIGPSGIGRVELWGTRDGGQTWRSFTVDNDNRSPLVVNVEEEGVYGFRVVVANGNGIGGKPPVPGDLPDLWVGVDLTKPAARIISAQQGVDAEAGNLIISWQADDRLLTARPISLSFSTIRGGPWLPIASGLENTGRYAWPLDNRTPAQVFLKLEVRDEAGNVAVQEMTDAVAIDQSRPTIRVREIRPVAQTGARSMRQR